MRIGFVELVLLLFIASITVGPNVALFADRWLRRAQRTSAAAARRKAQLEAQAAIEREALMTRFRVASNIFALLMLAALAYGLLLRPIDTPPKAYTAPDVRQDTGAAQTALSADSKDSWKLGGYLGVDCVRTQDGLVYAAAYNGAAMKKRQSDLVRTDGGHYAAILSVEGELTSFAFDADGDLWLTVVTSSGGALCRARHDSWGTSVEQVVTQIDGAPLGVLSAVETGPDGKVYFAVSSEAAAKNGLESALRTELIAHTGTGCVYVYDPSARTVEQVLGGVAGAAGLALSEDDRTLYVSDLGNRCIWAVDADARELTAGGKNCGSFVSGLPGYPGALALDEDGTLYISYRWTRSGWLEKHADSTLLRGIALRAGENIQKKLFKLPADAPCAEAVDTADGSWKQTFSGRELDGCTAVCPAGSKVYFGAAGVFYAVIAALIPLAVSGGIHLDGLCDTCDALCSFGDREKRLAILKDPHVGAFGPLWLMAFLLAEVGCFAQIYDRPVLLPLACTGFAFARAMGGRKVVASPCAKDSGLAHIFAENSDKRAVSRMLVAEFVLFAVLLGLWIYRVPHALAAAKVLVIVLAVWYAVHEHISRRVFGGVTGDLAGFCISLSELITLAAAAIGGLIL